MLVYIVSHVSVELNYVERGLRSKHNQAAIGELPCTCALMEFIPWTELSEEDHKFEGDREVTTK